MNDPMQPARIWILAGFILYLFGLLACSQPPAEIFQHRGSTMGTTFTVKIVSDIPSDKAALLKRAIDTRLVQINQILSTYQTDSELSLFNQVNDTDWHLASDDLFAVLSTSQSISEQSDGAFDATVGPLVNLWGFGPQFKADSVPTDTEIAQAQAFIGFQRLKIDAESQSIRKDNPRLYVDLSAIAKGYGVDLLSELIESQGHQDYMVEIGGEVFAKGHNAEGLYWKIAVEKPVVDERSILTVVPIQDRAIATSGNYRNFFELNDKRYSHTLNPVTGWPVDHDLLSVTVFHSSCMLADGWATALMVLGGEKGYDLALKNKMAVLFVRKSDAGFEEKRTPVLEDYLKGLDQ